MKDDGSRRVLFQAQLLAEIVIRFLVLLFANLGEVRVAEKALLGLFDLLACAVLGILCQDGPQR